jgi:hypothetical protein
MDQAWRRVKFSQLNGSASGARTILASPPEKGEQNPQRLIDVALMRLTP